MTDIFLINQKSYFTLEEAQELMPLIKRLTRQANETVTQLQVQIEATRDSERQAKFEHEIQELVKGWSEKLRKLGCEAKGLWLVDFDSGEGYYCWRYPEPELCFFHGYQEGFKGRVRIH